MTDATPLIEARVREHLAALGVEHEVLACDPDLADTAAFCAHYGYPLDRSANTIVVAARRGPEACACVALATSRLDVNHTVRDLLGVRRLSFASPEQTLGLTGMMIGGVTVFGLPHNLPVFIDTQVMVLDWVIIGGGSRSMKLRLAPAAMLRVAGARAVDGLAVSLDRLRDHGSAPGEDRR
jgi:prolyl-tRNA editing enzyme YbaK/EbsC (Cys-tRNA(Pro) deacylase)